MIDLDTAVKRYHERCQFYAWDVYLCLVNKHPNKYEVIRYLYETAQPASKEQLCGNLSQQGRRGGNQKTAMHLITTILCYLVKLKMIRTTPDRRYGSFGSTKATYALTAFGQLIGGCGQQQTAGAGQPERHELQSHRNGDVPTQMSVVADQA